MKGHDWRKTWMDPSDVRTVEALFTFRFPQGASPGQSGCRTVQVTPNRESWGEIRLQRGCSAAYRPVPYPSLSISALIYFTVYCTHRKYSYTLIHNDRVSPWPSCEWESDGTTWLKQKQNDNKCSYSIIGRWFQLFSVWLWASVQRDREILN